MATSEMNPLRWQGWPALLLVSLHGCGGPVPCSSDSQCVQNETLGRCLPSPVSDESWCAFPATMEECASGWRWGLLAGDSLADTCVDVPDAGPPDAAIQAPPPDSGWLHLAITREGTGDGRVTSTVGGIDCGALCEAYYAPGTALTLTALPDPGNTFLGWGGDCSGVATTCDLSLDGDRTVTADFAAPPGEVLWVRQFGEPLDDRVTTAVVDSAGDFIIAGSFEGTMDCGGGFIVSSAGSRDVFVAKLSGDDGSTIWALSFGGIEAEWIPRGAIDGSDDFLLTGHFPGSASTSTGSVSLTSNGDYDTFVLKISGVDGTPIWGTSLGGSFSDTSGGVAADSMGNVYATGSFDSVEMMVGADTLQFQGGMSDVWVAKLAGATGDPLWGRAFGSTTQDRGVGVAVDDLDSVVITGTFAGTVDFGGTTSLVGQGSADIYLAKYTSDGDPIWSQSFGGMGLENVTKIVIDDTEDITISGLFSSTMSFGGDTFMTTTQAIFVARYSVAGGHRWSRMYQPTGVAEPSGLAIHPLGDVYFGGTFMGTIDLGGGPLVSASYGAWVAQVTGGGGDHVRSRTYGGADPEAAYTIAASIDHVLVCGSFWGTAEFGSDSLTSMGDADAYCLATAP